ncbi:cell division protein FtsQ/DivIB [Sulfitobacter sabulilitoris]|uniref:Cell division protein FtsQ n=1 Tax=Sulfitobacter sabulilitoris TaxID=2562655 RepID=A0A5S3QD05_9RHOB|nr:cell division protein FtsQ/DivIB [Sulfitobacter sabulilitoris]TMM55012.1 FtsQ-type POTRA domain-containing protein [Sulfitobacter sabulilitoris]
MQPLKRLVARRPRLSRADPAPSRWAWRMQRLMLTPAFRFGLRVGVPFALTFAAGAIWLGNDARRLAIQTAVAEARESFESRPEFMVKLMAIDGASPRVSREIREIVPISFPTSSFDVDVEQVRQAIVELDPVKAVSVRIRPGGVLQIDVTPRTPVAIWRNRDGLTTVDVSGMQVATLERRDARPDLPLIAGPGAQDHIKEALDLYRAAAPLGGRLRGIVRMGERRWDVVLDREQRILLPETGALQALERVIALETAQDVLSRDVARVDMRLGRRPTVQMKKEATREWWHIRQMSGQ